MMYVSNRLVPILRPDLKHTATYLFNIHHSPSAISKTKFDQKTPTDLIKRKRKKREPKERQELNEKQSEALHR